MSEKMSNFYGETYSTLPPPPPLTADSDSDSDSDSLFNTNMYILAT